MTREVKKSLKNSTLDGSAHAAMLGLTQDYIAPFALALRATTDQIGLLASIPNLAMALSQLGSPALAEGLGSRKRLILPVVLVHAMLWLPILLVPHLFPGQPVWWLIAFFTLSTFFGSLGNPAWGSMMADLVPNGMRGRYFGMRGRTCGLVTLIFFFVGGVIIYLFSANILLGFSIIFSGAMFFRLVSWYFLSRIHEPPFSKPEGKRPGLMEITGKLRFTNLGRFIISILLFYSAVYMASPFFTVFMLRNLGVGYLNYVILVAICALSNFLFLPFWGRIGDRVGNIRVLKITSVMVSLVPVLWVVCNDIGYLVVVQIFSGCAWGGFTLASVNFLYDASPPENRIRWVALFNAATGMAICLGSLGGGFIAGHLPSLLGYNLLTLFLISGLLRGLVAITLVHRISEVNRARPVGVIELLFGKLTLRDTCRPLFQPFLSHESRVDRGAMLEDSPLSINRQPEWVMENRSPPLWC